MDGQAHILISGMVQGIGYRYFVARLASRMHLTGWVRNIPHGEVEILAEGQKAQIEALIQSLRTEHPYASVRNVKVEWGAFTGKWQGFEITR
jgi:acylphosphatase